MQNPYGKKYKKPYSSQQHKYGTRGQQGNWRQQLDQSDRPQQAQQHIEEQSQQQSQQAQQSQQDQSYQTNIAPQQEAQWINENAQSDRQIKQEQYSSSSQQAQRKSNGQSLETILEQIESLSQGINDSDINKEQNEGDNLSTIWQSIEDLKQASSSKASQNRSQGTSKNQQSISQIEVMQKMVELCQHILQQQTQHAQNFNVIEDTANKVIQDAQTAFQEQHQKPNIQQLINIFDEYTAIIDQKIVNYIEQKNRALQQQAAQKIQITDQEVIQVKMQVQNIVSFQQQFDIQQQSFSSTLQELLDNYNFLQMRMQQYTPEQLNTNRLSTRVYEQVIERVTTRFNEMSHTIKIEQTITNKQQSEYFTKEVSKLQNDIQQSIKKQQLYEYNIMKQEIQTKLNQQKEDILGRQEAKYKQVQSNVSSQILSIQKELEALKEHKNATRKFDKSSIYKYVADRHAREQIEQQQAANSIQQQQQQQLDKIKIEVQELINKQSDSTQSNKYEQRYQAQQPNTDIYSMPQIKVDRYKGTSNADLWMSRLENQLQLRPDIDEHMATLIALDNLQDQAYRWAHSHMEHFCTYYDRWNTINNQYSFTRFKEQFKQRFSKPLENFQNQLLQEKQGATQTYEEYARRINIIASQGTVQESYLKLVFLMNIRRQDVALQLEALRDNPRIDLIDLSREAHIMETRLNNIKTQDRQRTQTSKPVFNRNPRNVRRIRPRYTRPTQSQKQSKPTNALVGLESDNELSQEEKENIQFLGDAEENDDNEDYQQLDAEEDSDQVEQQQETINTLSQVQEIDNEYKSQEKKYFNVEKYFKNKQVSITLDELFNNRKELANELQNYAASVKENTSSNIDQEAGNNIVGEINASQERVVYKPNYKEITLRYINVRIKAFPTLAMIDTGAIRSTISKSFFISLRTSLPVIECNKTFVLANGDEFRPNAMVEVPISINETVVALEMIMVENVDYNILLGEDFNSVIDGGVWGHHYLYTNPTTKCIQSVQATKIKSPNNVIKGIIAEKDIITNECLQANVTESQKHQSTQSYKKDKQIEQSSTLPIVRKPVLTRREKFHKKLPFPLRKNVQQVENNKMATKYRSSALYPNFPLHKRYQIILVDYPIKYELKNALTPKYSVLSVDELKQLPLNEVADQEQSVVLSWASGITLQKVMDITQYFGYKHYNIFHVWRKMEPDGTLYTSKTLNATTTSPNYEFLVMAVKGRWKNLVQQDKPKLMQEVASRIQPHSMKPKEIYENIRKIFDVQKYNCLEIFATIPNHSYFDVYGNTIPQFFKESDKEKSQANKYKQTRTVTSQQPNTIAQVKLQTQQESQILDEMVAQMLKKTKLNSNDKQKAKELLYKYRQAFSLSEYEVGEIMEMEFPIDLIPGAQPYAQQPYQLSDKENRIIKEQLDAWVKYKYIERRNSEWASPAFLVAKGQDKFRMCVDYRYLNVFTVQVHWPLPIMYTFFPKLKGKQWISIFDLKSSYQNLRIRKEDQNKTAFTTIFGVFVCLRMLFGQKNSASYFQMAIEQILRPVLHKCVLVYIDDILVFSETLEQHYIDLEEVFNLLIKGNVKLHPGKSSLFLNEVEFLGHTIKNGVYYPRPKEYGILQQLQAPQNSTQLKSFLGLIGFYRKFIQNFSIIAKPLNELLKKNVQYQWTKQHEEAFQILKGKVIELPALHLPDNTKTYYLSTDFCADGIGAVVQQRNQTNEEYPVEFASRGLAANEKKYSSYEGEVLAVVWALQKFRYLLINSQFILYTDNRALMQVLQKGSQSMKIQRWLNILNDFSFLVIHRTSKENINADALSRLNPLIKQNPNINTTFLQNMQQVTSYEPIDLADLSCRVCKSKEAKDMLICELCGKGIHSQCIKDTLKNNVPEEFYYCNECLQRIKEKEVKDIILDFNVLQYCKTKELPSNIEFNERQRILKRAKQLVYDKEEKCFKIKINEQFKKVPTMVERRQIILEFHDNSAHPGILRTCSLILQQYYWRNVAEWVKTHISKCALCIANRAKYQEQEEYVAVPKGHVPGEYWAIDLATNLPLSKQGYKHILVCVDPFSKWTEVIPLGSKESQEITYHLHKNIISVFGKPLAFRSDRGAEFKGALDSFCQALGIEHYQTYPNHPQGNGQAESLVGFVIELIKRTVHQRQFQLNEWPYTIPTILYTLRFSNSVSNIPPYEIIFGRKPTLISPLDVQPKHTDHNITEAEVKKYAKELAEKQRDLFPKIKQHLEKMDTTRKTKHEDKVREKQKGKLSFAKGQMVFRNTGQRTTKLELSSQGPYVFLQYKGTTGAVIQDPTSQRKYDVNKYDLLEIPRLTEEPQDLQPHEENESEEEQQATEQRITRSKVAPPSQVSKPQGKPRGRPKAKPKRGRPKRSL